MKLIRIFLNCLKFKKGIFKDQNSLQLSDIENNFKF